ncbi:rRNA maturation RNase YbeY [Microbulbifer thermotolerans]|uniref:Endoribonuclease YbeY n=1 Tax=Microbulbifer thermotolerans TaxID=252514 RepID=A0A143HL34_MICTH|nr:rRNA maturation RNase YbeY [Microbulbifer thermotolerans]AMX01972.1 rRNA maturation RNase YbeY [Microbulbifer thermotolerans]MCX2780535.1 rRNA maturation RNase YbeY [Microbulbifer thermotolerans]MCX2783168.1 rRNA maturation RNase YbeY [Microbulbifer thermotolerans]MCX2794230.1 rRNA maturation RNase YbeY [Microbulbifer thermotolerans]MCX2800748.1 rRNA maturation RNase YbeY [Microbulbifer thermotolerans]
MIDLQLEVQRASCCVNLPSDEKIRTWVTAALAGRRDEAELTVRIVDADESRQLNGQYRGKDRPTNVLSFPADLPSDINLPLLGDLVICAPVVAQEADEQHKALSAHWAHMVVHGTLHLLGYDHVEDADAEVMEKLETGLLAGLGYPDPYAPMEESAAQPRAATD